MAFTEDPFWRFVRTGAGGPRVHPSAMRISDAERTHITDALCRHYADGRLDEAEFNERVAKASAAKTRADLAPLLADLPPFDDHRPLPEVPHVQPPRRRHPILFAAVIVLAALWFLSSARIVAHSIGTLIVVAVVVALLASRGRHRHRHPVP